MLRKCKSCGASKEGRDFYANRVVCKECCRLHRRNPKNLARRREQFKVWIKNNPEKRAAHNAVNNAIRLGWIKKGPCRDRFFDTCSKGKIHAHHPDYKKVYKIIWLCTKHHAAEHARMRREKAKLALLGPIPSSQVKGIR